MGFTIRPAQRIESKPLIGFYSESGKGKTLSALILARGFAGPKGSIVMIETEGGRGEAYVGYKDTDLGIDIGDYGVISMRGNFSPTAYGEAITAAEAAKPDVLIIDSASHEWEGEGGVLAMATANEAAGKTGMLVWQQPKQLHNRHFMLRFTQSPIPLVILCMRAKYPMKQVPKDPSRPTGAKEWTRLDVLEPKQADDILFEIFIHGWFDHQHRFHGSRWSLPELRQVMIDNQVITHDTGRRLLAYTKGQTVDREAATPKKELQPSTSTKQPPPDQAGGRQQPPLFRYISAKQQDVGFDDGETMLEKVGEMLGRQTDREAVAQMLERNRPVINALVTANELDTAVAYRVLFEDRIKKLRR